MPKADNAKIKLAHKRPLTYLLIVIVIGGGLALLVAQYYQSNHTLRVNGKSYHLLLATTTATQEKGLGDRASLPTNEAMLFVFPDQAVRCFWMKGMQFSLDMVWLNGQKQIVHIQPDVSPKTYPKSFCSNQLAEYVLELNAGQVKVAGMQIGQTLNF